MWEECRTGLRCVMLCAGLELVIIREKKINSLHVFATFLSVKTVSAKVHVNSVLVRALIIHVA